MDPLQNVREELRYLRHDVDALLDGRCRKWHDDVTQLTRHDRCPDYYRNSCFDLTEKERRRAACHRGDSNRRSYPSVERACNFTSDDLRLETHRSTRYHDDPVVDKYACGDSSDSDYLSDIDADIAADLLLLDLEEERRYLEMSSTRSNHRSVHPKPFVTQHNKSWLYPDTTRGRSLSEAKEKYQYVPRTAADISLGDTVQFRRSAGGIGAGKVKYVGHLAGKNCAYVGVELYHTKSSHNGVYNGHQYFECKYNRGAFIPFDKVLMAWTCK